MRNYQLLAVIVLMLLGVDILVAQAVPTITPTGLVPLKIPASGVPEKFKPPFTYRVLVQPYADYTNVDGSPIARSYRKRTIFSWGPIRVTSNIIARMPGQIVYYTLYERPRLSIFGFSPTFTFRKDRNFNRFVFRIGAKLYF